MRIDKWLWAARFFKTRGLAQSAIEGGKVHVNRQRTKCSRQVQIGDRLEITKGYQVFEVDVLGLNEQRRPFAEAQQLYQETEQSMAKREQEESLRKLNAIPFANEKPNKHQRKEIQKLKGKW